MNCKHCEKTCCKWGRQKSGIQRYYCKACKVTQQSDYTYYAYKKATKDLLPILVYNSVGVRGIARVLKIELSTTIKQIKAVADKIIKPPIPMNSKSFEIDELRTFFSSKENQYWVAYVICSNTKKVIDFIVGKRSKRNLSRVVDTALCSGYKKLKQIS